ncbi:protein roadkill-like protein [Dinothrombium tinctorium]|uniref:Protein roadkill-like protein n=1 Tax=Dinothrombium tinctorium TaxID=1965070 RepID=A0A3S3NY02_9ACAR|nr:protein roadkill-like protein [Dinothrombium tinctorium]
MILSDGSIKLLCEISLFEETNDQKNDRKKVTYATHGIGFNLWQSMFDWDAMIVARDGKALKSHKIILKAASPVFKTLLEQEQCGSYISECDFDGEIVEKVLQFLYLDFVDSDLKSDTLLKLFYAGEKYNVKRLKRICEENLSNDITIENCGSLLGFAVANDCKKLLQKVVDFAAVHFPLIIRSNSWKNEVQEKPEIFGAEYSKVEGIFDV